MFQVTSNVRTHGPQYYSNSLPVPQQEEIVQERKFAEKPNALKKVALDDLDDIQTNSISDGFSWTNFLCKYLFYIRSITFSASNPGEKKQDSRWHRFNNILS